MGKAERVSFVHPEINVLENWEGCWWFIILWKLWTQWRYSYLFLFPIFYIGIFIEQMINSPKVLYIMFHHEDKNHQRLIWISKDIMMFTTSNGQLSENLVFVFCHHRLFKIKLALKETYIFKKSNGFIVVVGIYLNT